MKNQLLKKFNQFALNQNQLISIKGGTCSCTAAAPYSCAAAGYNTNGNYNTAQFNQCMNDIYAGCAALGACQQ